jgi:hypothetical protein
MTTDTATVARTAAPGHTAAADEALRRLGAAFRDLGYRFTTVTPATHERVNRRPENAWARDDESMVLWYARPSATFGIRTSSRRSWQESAGTAPAPPGNAESCEPAATPAPSWTISPS